MSDCRFCGKRETWYIFRSGRPDICDPCWLALKYHIIELVWFLRDERLFELLLKPRMQRRKLEVHKGTKFMVRAAIHDKISEIEDLAHILRAKKEAQK